MTISYVDRCCHHMDEAKRYREKLSERFGRDVMEVHHQCFVLPEGVRYRSVSGLMNKIEFHERKAAYYFAKKMRVKMREPMVADNETGIIR